MARTSNTPIILLGVIALLIIAVMFMKKRAVFENFVIKKELITLNSCPNEDPRSGKLLYYNKKGDGICCSTKPEGDTCKQPTCLLSGRNDELISCIDYKKELLEGLGTHICPSKLPNCYINLKTLSGGCTDSPLNAQLTEPKLPNANKCKLYTDGKGNLDISNPVADNCITQKIIEDNSKSCFGTECQSYVEYIPSKNMNLYGLKFTDKDGQRRICYAANSYAEYRGSWDGFDKSSLVCSNARGAFVDRTIDPKSLTA